MVGSLSSVIPGEYIQNSAISTPVKVLSYQGACGISGAINGGLGCYTLSASPNSAGTVGSSGSPATLAGTTISDGGAIAPGPALTIRDQGPGITFPVAYSTISCSGFGSCTGTGSLYLNGTYDTSVLGGAPPTHSGASLAVGRWSAGSWLLGLRVDDSRGLFGHAVVRNGLQLGRVGDQHSSQQRSTLRFRPRSEWDRLCDAAELHQSRPAVRGLWPGPIWSLPFHAERAQLVLLLWPMEFYRPAFYLFRQRAVPDGAADHGQLCSRSKHFDRRRSVRHHWQRHSTVGRRRDFRAAPDQRLRLACVLHRHDARRRRQHTHDGRQRDADANRWRRQRHGDEMVLGKQVLRRAIRREFNKRSPSAPPP